MRPPPAASAAVRRSMQGNRSKDTKPELALRRKLWAQGVRGYRVHPRHILGKPDIYFPRAKLAIFLHGCWWHGCRQCNRYRLPKSNADYWSAKVEQNRRRDAHVLETLLATGYRVGVVWECELASSLDEVARRILALRESINPPPR